MGSSKKQTLVHSHVPKSTITTDSNLLLVVEGNKDLVGPVNETQFKVIVNFPLSYRLFVVVFPPLCFLRLRI